MAPSIPSGATSAPVGSEMPPVRPETDQAGTPAPVEATADLLGPLGRWLRIAVVAAVMGLLTVGSLVGDDDAFPFGPLRMYSTATKPTGVIWSTAIEVRSANGPWHRAALNPTSVGLNRAEVEGRVPQIQATPALLGDLARAHHRLRPHAARWTALRVVRLSSVIVDRRPTGEVLRRTLAQWGHG